MARVYAFDIGILLKRWNLGDKLQRLGRLSRRDVQGIELIVNDALVRRWPRPPKRIRKSSPVRFPTVRR